MAESERCRETRALLPELATGVAPGDDRAGALAHLAGCADCRRSLREVAVTVDDEYRQVLSTADGRSMTAAALRVDGGATRGTVFGYEGRPSWVFITVAGVDSGRYHVRLVTTAGHSVWIGRCEVRDGSGSWGTDVALPLREVDHVEMYGDGLPTLRADFTA